MRRSWLAFAVLAALVIAGAALLSVSTVRAERRRAGDELLRQALWRLDGRATALLLSAAARSAEAPGRPDPANPVSAHLEVAAGGRVTAAAGTWPGDALPAALAALLPGLPAPEAAVDDDALFSQLTPQQSSSNAFGPRGSASRRMQSAVLAVRDLRSGPVSARWAAGSLVLVRQVRRDRQELVQAAVLDWPRLQREFAEAIADLLPQARLEAADERDPQPDQLAALPARIVGTAPATPLPADLAGMLAAAWLAVAGGLAGGAAALAAAHRLAERRAVFVSAVTHELRTPLTALRLHADLVADERVGGDPDRRAAAVQVLRGEAARLGRLVENVLDYARLERRAPPRLQAVALGELLDRFRPALAARLAEAGMALEDGPPAAAVVRCDPEAVGRILVNLADNAAKYGAGPVRLEAAAAGGAVELRLRDHGPGLPAGLRLFIPFSRSAEAAAGAAPGVGLGLALCRQLARAQGGDLRLEAPADGPGTCAVLTLPAAPPASAG